MRRILASRTFLLASILLLSAFQIEQNQPITIFMIGDSTMANKAPERFPETGWGQVFGELFNDKVKVENHAVNGRSSRSFLDEGLWDKVYQQLKPGDYVFIQFGHNDQKADSPGRYTNPYTAYRANLERYVTETRSKGAVPVILSSIVRRKFNEKGTLEDTHGAYPLVARMVARETGAGFIDLQLLTENLVTQSGPKNANSWLHNLGSFAGPITYSIDALVSPSRQDLMVITPVPEPEATPSALPVWRPWCFSAGAVAAGARPAEGDSFQKTWAVGFHRPLFFVSAQGTRRDDGHLCRRSSASTRDNETVAPVCMGTPRTGGSGSQTNRTCIPRMKLSNRWHSGDDRRRATGPTRCQGTPGFRALWHSSNSSGAHYVADKLWKEFLGCRGLRDHSAVLGRTGAGRRLQGNLGSDIRRAFPQPRLEGRGLLRRSGLVHQSICRVVR